MSLPVSQLGWLAGVLDLKGVVLRKNNRQRATPQLVLAVESKQIQIVRELGRMTGTSPEFQKAKPVQEWMRRGCNEHCPEKHVHMYEGNGMPPIARWTVTGASMVVVLHNVLPYVRNDDKGFHEAMDEVTQTVVRQGQGRGAVDKALARLKELGWDIPFEVLSTVEAAAAEVVEVKV